MVPWRALNGSHLATVQCARGAERKRRRLEEEELQENLERAFQAYGAPLENVTELKYLGRVMTVGDDYWSEVTGNLQNDRKSWGRMSRILIQEGAYPKVLGYFCKAVFQAVLLFGAETWVLTPSMERSLSSFQHRAARRIIRRHPRRQDGRI